MRTLVISDLHLGQGGGVSVLARRRPMLALLETLDAYERLVLLGDVVELQEAPASVSFPLAEPVLRALAERLGPARQLILVPGNHDHGLVRDWAHAQGRELARENVVPPDASPLLAEIISWLSATRVEVHYPGLWLADRVWATHGHYLNHYLQPVSSWGLHARGRIGPPAPATPAELEYIPRRAPAPHMRDGLPPDRWLDRLMPPPLAPLTARLLGSQMQRHALPALTMTARALGVEADWIIFGHVHRRGPRRGDDPARWSGPGNSPRLLNTGSWRYEPVVAHRIGAAGGYWPGGAVVLEEDGAPYSVGLLDHLSEAELLG